MSISKDISRKISKLNWKNELNIRCSHRNSSVKEHRLWKSIKSCTDHSTCTLFGITQLVIHNRKGFRKVYSYETNPFPINVLPKYLNVPRRFFCINDVNQMKTQLSILSVIETVKKEMVSCFDLLTTATNRV